MFVPLCQVSRIECVMNWLRIAYVQSLYSATYVQSSHSATYVQSSYSATYVQSSYSASYREFVLHLLLPSLLTQSLVERDRLCNERIRIYSQWAAPAAIFRPPRYVLWDSPTGLAALAIDTIICFPELRTNPESVSYIDSSTELMHFAPRQYSGAVLTLITLPSYIVISRILFNPQW